MITKRLFFRTLSPTQEKVLKALATYKFLTTWQLLRLGIMTERANLNKQISELRIWRNPLLGSVAFGVHPKLWKLESVHHLTHHGAGIIKDYLDINHPIRFPKTNAVLFQQDYFHRIHTVDVHISLQERAFQNSNSVEMLFFLPYFDKVSSGKNHGYRSESYIPLSENDYLIADALCMLQTSTRKELYAVELYNGNDTKRVHQSLLHHLKALSVGQPSKMFGLDYGSRVLCIFELEVYKQMAMKRLFLDKNFAEAKSHFLFKSLEEVKQNVFEGWWLFDVNKVNLF